jgi:hypothetical protein
LEVYHAVRKNKSITLLGYILDPDDAQASNADIIKKLLDNISIANTFFEFTNDFGGRWILIVNDGENIILFNDAAGLRQVFYTSSGLSKGFWCASQPGLLAEVHNFSIDEQSYEFMNTYEYKNITQHWWPGDTSPYKEIKHLLPNHFLNLRTRSAFRYWPTTALKDISLAEGVVKSSYILRGLIHSAHCRFDLALPLTAGWDSRLILAASREIAYEIFYFTSVYGNATAQSQDVRVPVKLCSKLRLAHDVVRHPESVNEEFKKIYRRNVSTAHDIYCAYTQAIYDKYPVNMVCMKGDVSEVTKSYFRLPEPNRQEITGRDLALLSRMGKLDFATKAFDKWLFNLEPYNMHVLDLYCWEQDVGNCVAMIQAECDIVHESFSPLNCRTLLTTMLSVREKYRRNPDYQLYERLIKNLWAETLKIPVNPPEKWGVDDIIIRILVKTHLDKFVPKEIKRLGKGVLQLLERKK